jgi:hypothetical protein
MLSEINICSGQRQKWNQISGSLQEAVTKGTLDCYMNYEVKHIEMSLNR